MSGNETISYVKQVLPSRTHGHAAMSAQTATFMKFICTLKTGYATGMVPILQAAQARHTVSYKTHT